MKKIKCLFISPLASGNEKYGGEDAYTENLLKCPPEGVKYYFYKDLVKRKQAERLKCRRLFIHHLSKALLFSRPWAEYIACDLDFDLIHIHGYAAYLRGGIVKKKIPVVLSESSIKGTYRRDIHKLSFCDRRTSLIFKALNMYDQTFNVRDARKLILWSNWAKKLHENMGINSELITVIPPGINRLDNAISREKKDIVTLLFVGNEFERKGGPLLLRVFKRLKAKFKNIELVIISSYSQDLTSSEYGIRHLRHKSLDYLLENIYPQTDIFVLPTLLEGFGISIVEAMSFGIPVVSSNVGPIPEIVRDKESGFLISPKSEDELVKKLDLLISNKDLRQRLGEAAKIRFENEFSIESTNKKLKEAYLEVLR